MPHSLLLMVLALKGYFDGMCPRREDIPSKGVISQREILARYEQTISPSVTVCSPYQDGSPLGNIARWFDLQVCETQTQ